MIDLSTDHFPPFLEDEFERMRIPGDEKGFAISYSSFKRTECVACGLHGDSAIALHYAGEEYALKSRKLISVEMFETLCDAIPNEVKRSGTIAADIADGESYFVKWSWGHQKNRFVLSNPRHIDDDNIRQLALRLDEVMKKVKKARGSKRASSLSFLQKLFTGKKVV